jgi:hypothetical protein
LSSGGAKDTSDPRFFARGLRLSCRANSVKVPRHRGDDATAVSLYATGSARINQNQSDGRDTAAVDLVTRQGRVNHVNHPLLWDRQRRPKPTFDEVAKVLMTARG